jgi:molybdate transport repressor ModE-like protein
MAEARTLNHLQRVIDPLRLRLLAEVAARGSISAAADACRIGQPSASLHLRHLESAVGHRLIERNPSGSRLTPAGAIVARHGAEVLAALDGMADELGAYNAGRTGTLAAGVSTTVSYLIPRALQAFAHSHPRIDVDVRVSSSAAVHAMVLRHDVGLGISGELASADDVEHRHLFDDEVVGVGAPSRLELEGGTLTAERLSAQTLIMLSPGSSQRAAASRVLDRLVDHPRGRIWWVDSEETVKRAVRDGVGVSFLSRLAVLEELERGELTAFRVEGVPPMTQPVQLSWPIGTSLTVTQKAFATALTAAWRALCAPASREAGLSAAG